MTYIDKVIVVFIGFFPFYESMADL